MAIFAQHALAPTSAHFRNQNYELSLLFQVSLCISMALVEDILRIGDEFMHTIRDLKMSTNKRDLSARNTHFPYLWQPLNRSAIVCHLSWLLRILNRIAWLTVNQNMSMLHMRFHIVSYLGWISVQLLLWRKSAIWSLLQLLSSPQPLDLGLGSLRSCPILYLYWGIWQLCIVFLKSNSHN